MGKTVRLSIVIPALNEETTLVKSLTPLQCLRDRGIELLLVDGGSVDKTCDLACPLVDQVITSGRGRARQMNAGAVRASGQYVLFLHADTYLPETLLEVIEQWDKHQVQWGFFSLELTGKHWLLSTIQSMINIRSRLSGVGTGDQCLFFERHFFQVLNGFEDIPLMEDVAISKAAKSYSKPWVSKACRVITSSRRWEKEGIVKTMALMWYLRFSYFLGASPDYLARLYMKDYKQ